MSKLDLLIRKIDRQLEQLEKEERETHANQKCNHPVKDIGSSFDYLLNSAFDADREFYKCMADSKTKKGVHKCFQDLLKAIEKFECQKLKSKVVECGTDPVIPKGTVKCLIKADAHDKVQKCVGKAFEHKIK